MNRRQMLTGTLGLGAMGGGQLCIPRRVYSQECNAVFSFDKNPMEFDPERCLGVKLNGEYVIQTRDGSDKYVVPGVRWCFIVTGDEGIIVWIKTDANGEDVVDDDDNEVYFSQVGRVEVVYS